MIEWAKRWLESSKLALERESFNASVYLSQLCVETSSKAILVALGVDYPKEHDISMVFKQLSGRDDLPPWFRRNVDRISAIIKELAEIRGDAAYGYERGLSPTYFKGKAEDYAKNAEFTLQNCERLLKEIFR